MAEVIGDAYVGTVWAEAAAKIGATAGQVSAVMTECMRVYHLRPFISPSVRWQVLVPLHYPAGFESVTVLTLKCVRRDVLVPVVVMIPEGVDSL